MQASRLHLLRSGFPEKRAVDSRDPGRVLDVRPSGTRSVRLPDNSSGSDVCDGGRSRRILDFEKPISELEGKVKELQHLAKGSDIDLGDEIEKLEERADKLLRQTYAKLSPWQKTQVARHPERPHFGTISRRCSRISRRLPAIAPLATTRRSSAGWRAFAGARWS